MTIENESSGGSDIDVDSLVAEIEGGQTDGQIPMSEQAQAPTPAMHEIEFDAGGKPMKVPANDPRVSQWARQGYNYAQRMQEFNARQSEFETKQKMLAEQESKFEPYQRIDAFASKNPDWWKHVSEAWENRQAQGLDPSNPLTAELQTLKQELQEIKDFKNSQLQEKEQAKVAQEDSALNADIESIRKEYPTLDLDTPDAEGKNLELKVLEFARQKAIPDFKTAFIAFNHDRLKQLAVEQALSRGSKDSLVKKQAGIIGQTRAPTKQLSEVQNHKNKTWDQIHQETLDELGIH